MIEACIDAGVKKVVALSTDKASSPINLYGATKLVADKMFVNANHYAANYETRFSVVRYGNVMGSRGSVIPFFKKLGEEGKSLPITDMRMTRFWITLTQAVQFVIDSFDQMQGGELYVPRIPSTKVVDLAEAVAPDAPMHEIGLRPGEKLHEEMISPEEGRRALRLGDRYILQPTIATWGYTEPEMASRCPRDSRSAPTTTRCGCPSTTSATSLLARPDKPAAPPDPAPRGDSRRRPDPG